MATLLHSLTIPRPTSFSPQISSSLTPSSLNSLSTPPLNFSEFRGLKLAASTRSLGSASPLLRRRCSSRVVPETSETAVKLPTVTEDTWKSLVLESDIPVLVEFWAPWCGPCRMIQPIVDELSQEYAGKLKVFKVNTDDCPKVASEYSVRSIPTVLIFKNGEKKDAVIGAVPKITLKSSIEKFLLP